MKEITDKLDFIKNKSFWSARDNFKRMRRRAIEEKEILAQNTSDERLLTEIIKKLLKLSNKKMNNLIKKQAKDLNRYLTTEDTQMASKQKKRCLTLYVITELGIKTTMKYHYTPLIQNTKSKTLAIPNADEDMEQ